MKTNFPEYTSYKFNSGADVDTMAMLRDLNPSQYKDTLDRTDFLIQRELGKVPHRRVFHVIDTPGIAEDTASDDDKIATHIAAALSVVDSIHLVIVVVSENSCVTPWLKKVLRTYNTISPAMGGLIALVHTKVEFWKQHPDDKSLTTHLHSIRKELGGVMNRTAPHAVIDCDLCDYRPLQLLLRQHTIRRVLQLAAHNMPLHLNTLQLNKTPRMLQVDRAILDYSHSQLEYFEGEMSMSDRSTAFLFEINRIRQHIRQLETFINKHDSVHLDLIHEARFLEEASALDSFFSTKDVTMEAPPLDHSIDLIQEDTTGIISMKVSGGEGYCYWSNRVRRRNGESARYNAKLYAKRCAIHRIDLIQQKSELEQCYRRLKDRVPTQPLFEPLVPLKDDSLRRQQQELVAIHSRYLDLESFASQPTLDVRLFADVTRADVYEGDTWECVQRATDFFSTHTSQ
ncbi:hypothetical protein EC968_001756 [Mortierella alpina]|nr:hypothetical protein EC968_001756 [Mortierella alpina]